MDKYIGESARLVREMFGYAKEHEPCIIFMDEIDAIGGRRFSEGTSADREIQRTLMEVRFFVHRAYLLISFCRILQLLNQMDGFDSLGKTKLIMATNRPDTLDPALLRPGRLDRKIEIPLPNEQARLEILKIHAAPVNKSGEIDYEAIVKVRMAISRIYSITLSDRGGFSKLSDGFNGADLRNVVTEAGMFAIREDREYTTQEDYTKAARKISESKKHEGERLLPNVVVARAASDLLVLFCEQRNWNTPRCSYYYIFCNACALPPLSLCFAVCQGRSR